MNDTKGTRIWQMAVLLLVLCNIGLIVTLWIKPHPPGPPPPPPGGGAPREQLLSKLNFTDDQVKKYDVLIQAHQQEMHRLRNEGAALRHDLFSNLNNSISSGKLADSLTQAIGNNQKSIELVTFNHFSQVRALCTDQQKQEFDKIIVDLTKNMTGNNGRNGPPPPRPDGPDGPPPPPPPPGDQSGPPPPPPDGH